MPVVTRQQSFESITNKSPKSEISGLDKSLSNVMQAHAKFEGKWYLNDSLKEKYASALIEAGKIIPAGSKLPGLSRIIIQYTSLPQKQAILKLTKYLMREDKNFEQNQSLKQDILYLTRLIDCTAAIYNDLYKLNHSSIAGRYKLILDQLLGIRNTYLNSESANQLLSKGLTVKQYFSLKLLNKTYNKQNLDERSLAIVQGFILDSLGNVQLNAIIKKLKLPVLKDLVEDIYKLSFYAKNWRKFINIAQKFERNTLISYKELVYLEKFVKVQDIFQKLSQQNLFKNNTQLESIGKYILTTTTKLLKLRQDISLKTGDIIIYNNQKMQNTIGRDLGFIEKIKLYCKLIFSLYRHTAKIVENGSKLELSHITHHGPKSTEFTIAKYLYSDVFRLHVANLIKDDNKKKLQNKYGPNWEQEIEDIYHEVELRIHQNVTSRFEKIRYLSTIPKLLRFGISMIFPWVNYSTINSWASLHQKMTTDYYKEQVQAKEMICSEFIAKSVIASLYELDLRLKKELGISDSNVHIVEIPFDKKVTNIPPDMLIQSLQEVKCLEILPIPTAVSQTIAK